MTNWKFKFSVRTQHSEVLSHRVKSVMSVWCCFSPRQNAWFIESRNRSRNGSSIFFFFINFLQNFYFLFPECWSLQSWWPWSSRETSTRGYVGFAELEGEIGHFGEKWGILLAGEIDPNYQGKWSCFYMTEAGSNRLESKVLGTFSLSMSSSKGQGKTMSTKTKVRPLRIRPSLGRRIWVTLPTKEPQPPVVLAKGKGNGEKVIKGGSKSKVSVWRQ